MSSPLSGWRQVRLADVTRVVGGSTPPSGVVDYWNGNIVWITPTDLGSQKGRAITTSARRITRLGYESSGTELVPPGAVVLSSRAPIGHLGIAGVELCTNQGCKTFVPSAEVDSLFLYFALKASVPRLRALGSGATFSEISKTTLEDFEIGLPTLPEQCRISSVLEQQLSAVERGRSAGEARLEAAEALRRSLLKRVFASRESELWPATMIGDICDIQLGKMLSPKSKTGLRSAPYLRNANVQWDCFVLGDVATMDFDDRERRKFLLARNDLLVCEGGEPGRCAVWNGEIDPCFYQKALHRLRPKSDAIDPHFLMFRLWHGSFEGEFEVSHAKTTIAHLPAVRLAKLKLRLPPIDEQRRIVAATRDQLALVDRAWAAADEEKQALNRFPAALLNRAFRGEL